MTTRNWMIVFIITFFAAVANAQNKVVVVPLGGEELTNEQEDILDLFSYDAGNERLTIRGTAQNPLSEVHFQNINVRGASQVRQDFTTNAPDIPANSVLVEIEEETIALGSDPNNSQAVVVNAFANIDTAGNITCPCEFRSFIIQDPGVDQVASPPSFLEVEGGDNDIDATIRHTFAFIATDRTQTYSFQVQLWSNAGAPANGEYEVDEAGITLSTFGLAGVGTLKVPSDSPAAMDLSPEAAPPE